MGNKVALLILASSNIEVLNLLINKFDNEKFDIYIHLDKKFSDLSKEICLPFGAILLPNPRDASWGGFSLVEATFDLFKAARGDVRVNYSHYCLVSDSCFPIHSPERLFDFLLDGVSYINIGSETVNSNHPFGDRYYKYWLMDIPVGNPKGNALVENKKYLDNFLSGMNRPDGVPGYDFRVGSQWMCLSNEIMTFLLDEMNKSLYEYFRYTKIPDECLIHTFISGLIKDGLVSQDKISPSIHFVDFENQGRVPGFPRVVDETDLDRLLESGKFFVRKVSHVVSDELITQLNSRM